jgi:hypothetical protein
MAISPPLANRFSGRFASAFARTASTLGGMPGPVPQPEPQPQMGGTRTVDSYSQVRFQLIDAVAQSKTIVVTISVLNEGTDRKLRLGYNPLQYDLFEGRLIDDHGRSFAPSKLLIGNGEWMADLVSGVRTTMTVTFPDMPTVRGVLEADTIARLTLTPVFLGPVRPYPQEGGTIEFRNIPIRKDVQ